MKWIFLYFLIIFSTRLIAQVDQDHWEAYLARYEKGPGSTVVNMSIKEQAPMSQFPFLLEATSKVNHCTSDGLPEQDEWNDLYKISDEIKAAIEAHGRSKASGTFTYQCWRTDYYYITDTTGLRQNLMKVFKEFQPIHEYEIVIKPDPNWEAYLTFLYPNEETMEYISNQKILTELTKSGDKLEKPRPVDHWLYFKNEKGRSEFVKYAVQQNFKIESQEFNKKSDLNYALHISRTDKVDIQSISELTLQLRKKAKEFEGDYDGWETFVVKDK